MIIRSRPHGWQLMYILRGSIVPAIAPKVLAILILSIAVAAVVGLSHPILGEEPAAVVQIKAGHTVTEPALRAFIAARLAAFKVPVRVLFWSEILPRNPAAVPGTPGTAAGQEGCPRGRCGLLVRSDVAFPQGIGHGMGPVAQVQPGGMPPYQNA